MCLLFVQDQTKTLSLTDAQLIDMWARNKDGYGVMYAENGSLHTAKQLGTAQEWVTFYRSHEHRDAAFHLRMRTHGDTDLTNCHPYDIFGFEDGQTYIEPMAMMHNGILSTGNSKDLTKSDTWHYIRDYIRPLLEASPAMMHNKVLLKLIGEHIGAGNKFALMDSTGVVAIVNRRSGVEWNNMWFSNTYAWSAFDTVMYPGRPEAVKYPSYQGWKPSPDAWSKGRVWRDGKWVDEVVAETTAKVLGFEVPLIKTKKHRKMTNKQLHLPDTYQPCANELLADLEYLSEMLDFDFPFIGRTVNQMQRARLVNELGTSLISQFVEDVTMGAIGEDDMIAMFKDPEKAKKFYKVLNVVN